MPAIVADGFTTDKFAPVRATFEGNFASGADAGGSVSVRIGDETVVDLWGGTADKKTAAPWTRDTVSVVFSCTKGATAICAHVLASRGKLDIDAPVAELWPAFAQNGKEAATTRIIARLIRCFTARFFFASGSWVT